MKSFKICFFCLSIIALFAACDKKKAQETTIDSAETTQPEVTNTTTEQEPEEPKERPYQIVGFQKTACFGKCPVFQAKIFSDNTATWHGKMNVARLGWHQATLDEQLAKEIRAKAFEVGYFDFYGEYPLEYKVPDLPTTITYIRVGDMEKTIKNTHDGPEKLADFEKYLEEILLNLDWQYTGKD